MMRLPKQIVAILLVTPLFASCMEDNAKDSPTSARSSIFAPAESWRPQEAQFRRLSRKIPEYGGHFFDAEGNLVVYLTDLAGAVAARLALEPVLRARQSFEWHRLRGVRDIVMRVGAYDFDELSGWRDRLSPELINVQGVLSLDLDEAFNRVTVGVDRERSAQARAETQILAAELQIPFGALAFADEDTVYVDTAYAEEGPAGTLSERRRPLVGGIQVAYRESDGDPKGCTIGLVMQQYGVPAIVTNTHCSKKWGELDYGAYYQNYVRSIDSIGSENWDRHYDDCGFYLKCRRSDATIVRLTSDTLLAYPDSIVQSYFKIARPVASGGIAIDTVQPEYKIDGRMDSLVGDSICIVGRKSGRQCGSVTATCQDIYQWFQKRLYCTNKANYSSQRGDSGAPVFMILSSEMSNVVIAGIHFGTHPFGTRYFSPYSNILDEYPGLGPELPIY